ncbi:ribonuclease 3-like protein 2 [Quercus suber]|uniref:Ribonuclease 3-like protein 2 n=1 Tax=Quercus suber TaxID=58331 RepID=A0AAW0LQV4_QUESU
MDSRVCPVEEEPPPTFLELAAEKILSYKFKDKKLLRDALTQIYNNSGKSFTSWLEILGDDGIVLTVKQHLSSTYPSLDPGQLLSLRAANTSDEKLARVAVRHGLHHVTSLLDKDKKLLRDALTQIYNNSGKSFTSWLEILGDDGIVLTVKQHLSSTYPSLDPGQLLSLRAANTSDEKLARVAVRHGLHHVTSLLDKV